MTEKRRRKRIPRNVKAEVAKRDAHTCRYCGTKVAPFHVDHVYPDSKGGVTEIDNLVLACEDCNWKKRDVIGMWPKPIGFFGDKKPPEKKQPLSWVVAIVSLLVAAISVNVFIYLAIRYPPGTAPAEINAITVALIPVILFSFMIFAAAGTISAARSGSLKAKRKVYHQ